MNKKVVLWLALLIVLSTIACAVEDSFLATIEPQEVVIKQEQTAEFNLSITHTSDEVQTFEIYSENVIWDVRVQDPLIVDE